MPTYNLDDILQYIEGSLENPEAFEQAMKENPELAREVNTYRTVIIKTIENQDQVDPDDNLSDEEIDALADQYFEKSVNGGLLNRLFGDDFSTKEDDSESENKTKNEYQEEESEGTTSRLNRNLLIGVILILILSLVLTLLYRTFSSSNSTVKDEMKNSSSKHKIDSTEDFIQKEDTIVTKDSLNSSNSFVPKENSDSQDIQNDDAQEGILPTNFPKLPKEADPSIDQPFSIYCSSERGYSKDSLAFCDYILSAEQPYDDGKNKEALNILTLGLKKLNSKDTTLKHEIQIHLSNLYIKEKKFDLALKYSNRILLEKGSVSRRIYYESVLYSAWIHLNRNDYNKARKVFDSNPEVVRYKGKRAKILKELFDK